MCPPRVSAFPSETSTSKMKGSRSAVSRTWIMALSPPQSPVPGLSDNKLALSGLSSHSLASGGGSRFTVMFGQTRAYSALMPSHFSSPASVSGLIASTGHSGSQTPQSMHSSGYLSKDAPPRAELIGES